jgi:hypothetical protein
MRKILLIICFINLSQIYSQDNFRFKSIDGGVGTYKMTGQTTALALGSNIDIATSYKSNIFTLSNILGLGLGRNEDNNTDLEAYFEVSLLYGREFEFADNFKLENTYRFRIHYSE